MYCDSEVNSLGRTHSLPQTSFPTATPLPLPGVNHFQSIPPLQVGCVAVKANGSCWCKDRVATLDMRRHAAVNCDALSSPQDSCESQSPAFALTLMRKCRLLGRQEKKKKTLLLPLPLLFTIFHSLPAHPGDNPRLKINCLLPPSDSEAMDTHTLRGCWRFQSSDFWPKSRQAASLTANYCWPNLRCWGNLAPLRLNQRHREAL